MNKIIVTAVWLLILLIPVPFLSNILIMEEGHFAYLAVNTEKSKLLNNTDFILIGREKGVDRWQFTAHPVLPYLVIAKVFRAFSDAAGFDSWTLEEKTIKARLPFYITYVLSMLPVIFMGAWLFRRKTWSEIRLPVIFIGFLGTCPLLVGGGLQTYYDGNIGVLLTTLCAMGLAVVPRVKSLHLRAAILFGCGFISAMGKSEWVFAFMAAVIGTMILYSASSQKFPHFRFLCFSALVGAAAGTLLHFCLGPDNYIQGIYLMYSFGYEPHRNYIYAFLFRLPWLFPFIPVFIMTVFILRRFLKELLSAHFTHMILLLWATFLFFGFIITPHLGDGFPRYFCLSMAAFLSFLTIRMEYIDFLSWSPKIRLRLMVLFCSLIILHMGYFAYSHISQRSIGSIPGRSLIVHKAMFLRRYEHFKTTGEIQKTDASMAYYFQDMDFINNG